MMDGVWTERRPDGRGIGGEAQNPGEKLAEPQAESNYYIRTVIYFQKE